jgi:hypothetical protein
MITPIEEQLSKEVPTHLFKFEEKIFGLTIPQIMIDLFVSTSCWYIWQLPYPPVLRIALLIMIAIVTIVTVHIRVKHRSLMEWLGIMLFFWLTPPEAIHYNKALSTAQVSVDQKPKRASVQAVWVRLQAIENGYMRFGGSGKEKKGKKPSPDQRYSAVLEVTGANLQLLAEHERARIFQAYESFLAGLEFPLQIISHNETIDLQAYEPLCQQEQQLVELRTKPRLEAIAKSHLRFLYRSLGTCVVTRHFVVISATPLEESLKSPDGKSRSILFGFFGGKQKIIATEQVIQQLRIRVKVVKDGFKAIGLQVRLLDDEALARFYVTCLTPGFALNSSDNVADQVIPIYRATNENTNEEIR